MKDLPNMLQGESVAQYVQRCAAREKEQCMRYAATLAAESNARIDLLREAIRIIRANSTFRHDHKDWLQRASDNLRR